MTDLRKAAEMALETLCVGANDAVPNDIDKRFEQAIQALRQALAEDALKTVADIDHSLGLFVDSPSVDAVNMSQERVDETAKGEHEPWPSAQCVCGGTIYFKYTPPVSDYHEGWEEGFKAAKRKWVGLTDDDIWDVMCKVDSFMYRTFARELEQKIKEKNS